MRIGIVCPYSWDIPGGVQAHVRDLAEKLIELGHHVSVLAPGEDDAPDLPPYVVAAGKAAVRIPYNGSVARLQFGLVAAARVRKWLRDGDFDVVHVHEPAPPSLSLLDLHDPRRAAGRDVPRRLRPLALAVGVRHRAAAVPGEDRRPDRGLAGRPQGARRASRRRRRRDPERRGRLALRRRRAVRRVPAPGRPRGGTIGFIGRYDETRKGMDVLVDALEILVAQRPDAAAAGRRARRRRRLHGRAARAASPTGSSCSGRSASTTRRGCCAASTSTARPNTGGESFGVILLEAMAARTAIVASDIDAFRRVLAGGRGRAAVPGRRRGRAGRRAGRGARRPRRCAPGWSRPAARRWRRTTGR